MLNGQASAAATVDVVAHGTPADVGASLDVIRPPRRPRLARSQVDTLAWQMQRLREGLALAADRAAKLRVRDPAAACDDLLASVWALQVGDHPEPYVRLAEQVYKWALVDIQYWQAEPGRALKLVLKDWPTTWGLLWPRSHRRIRFDVQMALDQTPQHRRNRVRTTGWPQRCGFTLLDHQVLLSTLTGEACRRAYWADVLRRAGSTTPPDAFAVLAEPAPDLDDAEADEE